MRTKPNLNTAKLKAELFRLYDEAKRVDLGKMDCGECDLCEHVTNLYFLPHEREYIEKRTSEKIPFELIFHGKNLYEGVGDSFELCPFFVKGKCRIYDYRPLVCRFYPVDIDIESNFLKVYVDTKCPRWEKIAKDKVYLEKVVDMFLKLRTKIRDFDYFWLNLPFDSDQRRIIFARRI